MAGFRSKSWLWFVPVGVTAALLLFWTMRPEKVEIEVARAVRADFVEEIRSEGVLRSRKRVTVPAFAEGDMRRVDLRAGDPVRKGQEITSILWDLRFESLRAPMSGVVSKVFRESAGPVRRGDPILELVDPADLEGVLELLTPDAVRVRPGMKVSVEAPGFEQDLPGRVEAVSRAGFVKISALGVEEERTEVRIRLGAPPKRSGPGNQFHMEAVIELARKPGALLIPVGAAFREGEQWGVYRIREGRARRTVFEAGRRSGAWQEVLSGLREGDEIVNFPGDRVRDGIRVRSVSGESGNQLPSGSESR